MPIYTRTYRSYDGDARPRFRWWVMIPHELRILIKVRTFLVLLVLGYLHVCFRILQIMAYDTLSGVTNNPLTQVFRQLQTMSVDPSMFYDFLRIQSSLVFLATILAGAGMICDDFKNNLMEVYFSKPLTWRDYVLGKTLTLILVGFAFTAIPGVLLVLLHNLLAPGWETLQATWFLPHAIIGFSLVMSIPCALCVLASSALSRSERYASISVFMVLFANLVLGELMPDLLQDRAYAIIAFPLALNRIGEWLFREAHPLFGISPGWSAVYVALVCAGAAWIVCRKVKRAEVAA